MRQSGDRNQHIFMPGQVYVNELNESGTAGVDESYRPLFGKAMVATSPLVTKDHAETLSAFAPAIRARLCVPQATGELILQRQITLIQSLIILVDDILEAGSPASDESGKLKKSTNATTDAMLNLSITAPPVKVTLPDILANSQEQSESLRDYLNLLATEPVVLAYAVNIWFYSRPELIADEKGRVLPAHTDKYTSAAVLDAIQSTVKSAAIWIYMTALIKALEDTTSKPHRATILQEISNLCQLEYSRVQGLFRRHVQTGIGSKWFKRNANSHDSIGNPRTTMKENPEELTRSDPQLHYILRLCQTETSARKALEWMKKLSDLQQAHPLEREKLQEREFDALLDLFTVISFVQNLSLLVSLPSPSRKKGQEFLSKLQDLDVELQRLRAHIDLRNFVIPIDNLKQPGVADGALKALDAFFIDKTGTKLGFLYEDSVTDSLASLKGKQEVGSEQNVKTDYIPLESGHNQEENIIQRRCKEKTRPSHSSVYEIASVEPPREPSSTSEQQRLTVNPSTAQVFSTLFRRSEARGSLSWVAFESAMADLGFSIFPKFGSVYTFNPPAHLKLPTSFTIHRPHQSRIEGHMLLIIARRLKRVYGWNDQTFVA
ncbi:hypothetical protein HJFPF1_00005 [Paramyrothecium foliicola]|nr:hypothetical protein HJFPF1_00005 [Paramyrothecium foliicola]